MRLNSEPPRPDAPVDAIAAAMEDAAALYHRLVLVVGEAGANSNALAAARERLGTPLLNVGLELSRQLLELSVRERPLQVRTLLEQCVQALGPPSDVVLLDRIELLFAPDLRQDPLRLLQGLSRNRTVVAAWTGTLAAGTLRYAEPPHPEYRPYPAEGILIVPAGTGDEAP